MTTEKEVGEFLKQFRLEGCTLLKQEIYEFTEDKFIKQTWLRGLKKVMVKITFPRQGSWVPCKPHLVQTGNGYGFSGTRFQANGDYGRPEITTEEM